MTYRDTVILSPVEREEAVHKQKAALLPWFKTRLVSIGPCSPQSGSCRIMSWSRLLALTPWKHDCWKVSAASHMRTNAGHPALQMEASMLTLLQTHPQRILRFHRFCSLHWLLVHLPYATRACFSCVAILLLVLCSMMLPPSRWRPVSRTRRRTLCTVRLDLSLDWREPPSCQG